MKKEMELLPTAPEQGATHNTDVAQSRAIAEVQGMMTIAQSRPRNEMKAFDKMMKACERRSLAETSIYSYPKGGKQIEGPTIRLAEMIARCYGNLDFGVVELEQKHGESLVLTYCLDLETNTRQSKVFTVKHTRKSGQNIVVLTDPRDIYEMVANQGARRLRACILGIIPGDMTEAAVQKCNETMQKADGTPIEDRIRKLVAAFSSFGVTPSMLEAKLGHNLNATNEQELVNLRKTYLSLKDGMSKVTDWFTHEAPPATPPAAPEATAPSAPRKRATRKKVTPAPEVSAPEVEAAPPDDDLPMDPLPPSQERLSGVSPHGRLEKLLDIHNIGIGRFLAWAEEVVLIKDATSYGDIVEIPIGELNENLFKILAANVAIIKAA